MKTIESKFGLSVKFSPSFLDKEMADDVFNFCDSLKWKDKSMNRRSNITFGQNGLVYVVRFKENVIYRETIPWEDQTILINLKKMVEELTVDTAPDGYNYCVIMRYPHNGIIIKPHRDKEMVRGTSICGISVGNTRRLRLTHIDRNIRDPKTFELSHGSLYCLLPPTNDKYLHEILPEDIDAQNTIRYSLTFRNVIGVNNIPKPDKSVKYVCQGLLKSGLRKNEICGASVFEPGATFCKRHQST